ncbi:hypothetical protein M2451_001548 [Dysgonomonas sp. PFB1-18]|uniref:DUF3298 and DUF4163 domain-containing protein n=1 Tax=unclassified Dysgonomonas TaxID=2630389 RepID=UPI002474641E|nr:MULTISPECIES: DUF3298 and DUF4163 domain-containing protein [unclassified Dysgonomonas]MDH6308994.1 hypothetical protein [Dysgonomonas sp. PF1-14]MDH6338745.1 hypothetical protein [Dysgonomonas sp. PF1-16]MDH6380227.1 hypothetical protein [Dysgonomonas sp. PFB1-18]MDH6397557.1 hypothetical protein [Dysgonomonas sp. PF1-23]
MKSTFILFLATVFLATSCNSKKTESSSGDTWKFDSLTVDKRVHINNDVTKDGMLIKFNFVYPTSVPESLNLKEVQNIFACIITGKNDFQGTPQEAFDQALTKSTADAEELAKDMGNEDLEYTHFSNFELMRSSEISMDAKDVITVAVSDYSYTGGAHGMHGTSYRNIDKRSGTLIKEDQLFKPGYADKLAILIQNEIERRNNAESKNEVEAIPLLEDVKDVKPNGNFYFTKDGVTYAYNIYEISPYSQGIVEITIPHEQITPLVNDQYLQVIDNLKQEL